MTSTAARCASTLVACLALLSACAGSRPQLSAPLAAPTLDPPRHRFAWGGTKLCALRSPGVLVCWGGQISHEPMRVYAGFSDFVEVAVGEHHLCALRANGEVHCLGDNYNYRLGDPGYAAERSDVLRRVPGLPPAVRVVASGDATCAVTERGEVYCFGAPNEVLPGIYRVDHPTLVPGLRGVTQMSLAAHTACAVRQDGSAHCWGGTSAESIAEELPGISDAVEVASSDIVRCVRRRSGAVACSPQPGPMQRMSPLPATARWELTPSDVTVLEVDGGTVCGQRRNGEIECTGWNWSERVKSNRLSELNASAAFALGPAGVGCGIDAGGGVRSLADQVGVCGDADYGYSAESSPLLRLGSSRLSGDERSTDASFEGGLHLPLLFGTTLRAGPFIDVQTRSFSSFEPAAGLSIAAPLGSLVVALDAGAGHVFGDDLERNFALAGLRIGGGVHLDGSACQSGCGFRYFASAALELQMRRSLGQESLNDVSVFFSFDPIVLAVPFAVLMTDWNMN